MGDNHDPKSEVDTEHSADNSGDESTRNGLLQSLTGSAEVVNNLAQALIPELLAQLKSDERLLGPSTNKQVAERSPLNVRRRPRIVGGTCR